MPRVGVFVCALLGIGGCAPTVPQQVRDLNQEGVGLLAQRNYPAARKRFEQAVNLDPAEATSVYNLGNAAHHEGGWQLAEKCYRECLQRDADHAGAHHGLALLLVQHNRAEEARRLIDAWLVRRPNSADAHAEQGWLLRESGDLPAAQARLWKALELDPQNPRALVEMGIYYESCRYPERARGLYQRALEREPNHPEATARLARLRTPRDRPPPPAR